MIVSTVECYFDVMMIYQPGSEMPIGSLTGTYRSLTGSNAVYRSTTVVPAGSEPVGTGTGLLDGFKKAFSFVSGTTTPTNPGAERLLGNGPTQTGTVTTFTR